MTLLRNVTFGMLLAAALTTSAQAAEFKAKSGVFAWLSVGTVYALEEGHILWIGEFSGTSLDNGAGTFLDHAGVQCPGYLDVLASAGTAKGAGSCIWTLTSGDKVFASWQCEGGAPMSGKACDGPLTVTGGTGKMAGIAGSWNFHAYTVAFHPDGKGSGYSDLDEVTYTLP